VFFLVQKQETCLVKGVQGFSPAGVWGVPILSSLSQRSLLKKHWSIASSGMTQKQGVFYADDENENVYLFSAPDPLHRGAGWMWRSIVRAGTSSNTVSTSSSRHRATSASCR
jgi:hypothetical protein